MKELITGGMTGLLMGIAIQRCALTDQEHLRGAVAFTRRGLIRVLLAALGLTAILFAFLGWLAVIDVDWLQVIPLHGGTLIGGAVFGAAMAWIGMSPGTALSGVGGGRLLESLCAVMGCLAGGLCLPYLEPLAAPVRGIISTVEGTFFRVTLDKPYLFSGGFLGQGCVGLVLLAAALCLRPEWKLETDDSPVPPPVQSIPDQPVSAKPEDVQDETFVAILPGEEPVVVDTAPDGEPPAEAEESSHQPADGVSSAEPVPEKPSAEEIDSASSDPIPDSLPADDFPILPGDVPPLTEALQSAPGDAAEQAAMESMAPAPPPPAEDTAEPLADSTSEEPPPSTPPLEEAPAEEVRPPVDHPGKPSKKKARKGKKERGAGGKTP